LIAVKIEEVTGSIMLHRVKEAPLLNRMVSTRTAPATLVIVFAFLSLLSGRAPKTGRKQK
jgi:hypothetical protein